jgi:acetylornithine/N-succinyldiaminopimelate aminotransferase
VRSPYQDLLGPGTHASTFGGTPLACAVALKVLEVVRQQRLDENARHLGDWMKRELERLAETYPRVIHNVRGLGFMLGFELAPDMAKLPGDPAKLPSARFVNLLHAAGLLTIPAGANVIRLLPALNLTRSDAEEGIAIIESVVQQLA